MVKKRNEETFNDGIAFLCKTSKRSIVEEVGKCRFGLRTVGVHRFYQAKILGAAIDNLISVPLNDKITTYNMLIIISGEQYEITQIQKKYDTFPPAMYLTLNKALPVYSDERRSDNEDS